MSLTVAQRDSEQIDEKEEEDYEKWYCKLVQCVELPDFLLNEEQF